MPRARPVGQYEVETGELIKRFPSLLKAAESIHGAYQGCISAVCRGRQMTAYGYIWKYLDEEESKGEPHEDR